MSWHHNDYIDLFSSIGSLAAAGIAAYAAKVSSKSAKESNEAAKESNKTAKESNKAANDALRLQQIIDEDRRSEKERDRLIAFLSNCAEKANKFDNLGASLVPAWDYDSVDNIVYSADSARNKIESWLAANPKNDKSEICQLFLERLNFRVEQYFLSQSPVFNPETNKVEVRKLRRVCRDFFIN